MKRIWVVLLLSFAASAQSTVEIPKDFKVPHRPVHTFSIVARDPQTGEIGVAVQSHWFSVGSRVAWAEAGVGAVATQSFTDPAYGKLGLDLMRAGKSADEALAALLQADYNRDVRQVGIVDAEGRTAAWTGARDIEFAGHDVGSTCGFNLRALSVEKRMIQSCMDHTERGEAGARVFVGSEFSVQANLMTNDRIWPAMYEAYYAAKKKGADLADRMLAALDAAQAVGGDIRGRQSAALIIVKAKSSGKPWDDRVFDLRVDDHPYPLKELRRLVTLQRAYNHMNSGDEAVEHKDNEAALREYSAAEKLIEGVPDIDKSRLAEMKYWHAVALVTMNRVDESLPLFKQAFAMEPNWRVLTPRLPKSGLLPDDKKLIERITSQ
jgi:uncharacterized Ntn-hydrolase superfamily protein